MAINFVLELVKDLQKLLETLEKEFGGYLRNGKAYYKKKIREKSSKLTNELYEKYKNSLNLKIERTDEQSNILLNNYDDKVLLIPKKYQLVKEKFDSLIYA